VSLVTGQAGVLALQHVGQGHRLLVEESYRKLLMVEMNVKGSLKEGEIVSLKTAKRTCY